MIDAIFYARFLRDEGTRIIYQNPSGSIIPEPCHADVKPLVDFEAISEFVIPRQAFCNRLVTVVDPVDERLVVGFPVCLSHRSYDRNEFMFNFGFVLGRDMPATESAKYEMIVRRLAQYFTELEVQNHFLSAQPVDCGGAVAIMPDGEFMRGQRSIPALLETIKEDLNNYSECMIPVDDANTINLKLFPVIQEPPQVKGWHVPVLRIKLEGSPLSSFASSNRLTGLTSGRHENSLQVPADWDLTVQRIIPFIDGVNDVRRIAQLADTALDLTRLAIQHLLMYRGAADLVDRFAFANMYVLQPMAFDDFVDNVDAIQDECARFVCPAPASGRDRHLNTTTGLDADGHRRMHHMSSSAMAHGLLASSSASTSHLPKVASGTLLCQLYARLQHGTTVKELIRQSIELDANLLQLVDPRRLVQFGITRRFVRRVHKWPVFARYIVSLEKGGPALVQKNAPAASSATMASSPGDSKMPGSGLAIGAPKAPSSRPSSVTGTSAPSTSSQHPAGGTAAQEEASPESVREVETEQALSLLKYTDGCHCMDQIISETGYTEADITKRLALLSKLYTGVSWEVQIMYR